ncbi:hypothetical protein LTR08_000004 [Meristemomyces frigidus]|nr:hypothetical protein LTR08_000004 [Meristemomyces frigidus]
MGSVSETRIVTLAATIQTHTDVPSDPVYPADIENSRAAVLGATQELVELLRGPRQLIQARLNTQDIVYHQLIEKFDIASLLPNGEVSYAELAATTGMDESALRRVLRFAITNRIFAEKRPGYLSHSAASRVLAEDQGLRDWITCMLRDILPSGYRAVDALVKWPGAQDPSKTGFALAHGAGFWDVLAKDPERGRRFAGGMRALATGDVYSLRHVTSGFPWAKLGETARVVDVGGSTGNTAFALTQKFPQLQVIVQDVPDTVAKAEQREGQSVTFMAHDFFAPQPVEGADVYLFRWILALKPGARVLIMDAVLPPVGTVPNAIERNARHFDVVMQHLFDAKEREMVEWQKLFADADGRFRFCGTTQPEGSRLAIMELKWEP